MPLSQIQRSALDYLARRDYAVAELRQKLRARFLSTHYQGTDTEERDNTDNNNPEALIDSVIQQLQDQKLLDDQRFCEIFIRYRVNKGDGPLKIRQALQQKGVDSALIAAQLAQDETDWEAHIRQVWQKKFKAPVNQKERQKQQRFLAQRGFEFEQIHHLFQTIVTDAREI